MISLKSLEIKRQDYDYPSENKLKGNIYATVAIDGQDADIVVRLSTDASMKLLKHCQEIIALSAFEMAESFRQEFIKAMEGI
jgi:hypothetical protein